MERYTGELTPAQMFEELRRLTITLNKNVLTVDELCMLSGLTRGYVYNLVSKKKIPHYKSSGGKLTFFKRKEIENWLCAKQVPVVQE